MRTEAHHEPPPHIIRPPRWLELDLQAAWRYRELLAFLVWRDLKVRYKQTLIGAAWAVLQPLLTMLLFVLFFGRIARIPVGDTPYPVFFYSGIVAWTYFAQSVTSASQSTLEHQTLITKVYFPRLLLPLAGVLGGLVDFAISFSLLFVLLAVHGTAPAATVVLAPAFLLLALITALGVGLWLSALNARYRDVRYVLPLLVQLWMFASPVIYPAHLVPAEWRFVYGLNPMAGVIEGFRWSVLGGPGPGAVLVASLAGAILLLVSGFVYFQRTEQILADVV